MQRLKKQKTKMLLLTLIIVLGNAGLILGETEESPLEFYEEGPLHLPVVFHGVFFGSIFNSFLHLLASLAPLRLPELIGHVIIPDILTVISPTHGVGEEILVDIPSVIFRVIPDFLLLVGALLLIPIRILLFPLFILGLPFRILLEGIGNLYRKISVQPKLLIRLRLWLNKFFHRPFFVRLKNFLLKVRLELRKIRDLIRPNIITVIVKAILGFIVGALIGIIPRIKNVLSKLELFIRKVLTPGVFGIFKPFGPPIFLRLKLFLEKVLRPGLFRLIRPVPLLERLRLRFLG